jgi:hypothetical protein
MFQSDMEEARVWWTEVRGGGLRSQIVTGSHGGRRYLAYAFKEQGVAMLSDFVQREEYAG